MKTNQKGNIHLLVMIIVIFAILLGVYTVQQRTNFLPQASNQMNTSFEKINSPGDLDKAMSGVDSTDVTQLDTIIDQNSTDASSL